MLLGVPLWISAVIFILVALLVTDLGSGNFNIQFIYFRTNSCHQSTNLVLFRDLHVEPESPESSDNDTLYMYICTIVI
jgi:hypothetical protein